MPKAYELVLSEAQRTTLEQARAHHPKTYARERAAALLKVADGTSMRQVAATGLLQVRRRETIKEWIDAFLARGVAGLLVQAGRGRKPAFSPSLSRRAKRSASAAGDSSS